MLRARKKDVRIKPNRKLDKRSSRGMLYENEELRLRTIEINAEVERGQTDIKKLRRENDHLRREMWALRDEYERLEKLIKHLDLAGTSQTTSLNGCSDSNSDGGGDDRRPTTAVKCLRSSQPHQHQLNQHQHQGVYIECSNNADMDNIQNYQKAYGRMPRRCSSAGARVYRSSTASSIHLPLPVLITQTQASNDANDSSSNVHRAYESVEPNSSTSVITTVTTVSSAAAAAAVVTADEDEEDGYAACSHLPYRRAQFLRPPSLETLPPALPPLPPPQVIPLGFARSSLSPEGCPARAQPPEGSGTGDSAAAGTGEATAAVGGSGEAGEGEDCPLVPPDTPSEDGHFNLDHLVNIVRSFREEQQIHQSGLLITTSSTASEEDDDDDDDDDEDEDEQDDDDVDLDDDDDDDEDDDDDDEEDEDVAVYHGGSSQGIMVALPALASFRRSATALERSRSSSPESGRLGTVKRQRRKQLSIEKVSSDSGIMQQHQQHQQQLVRRLSSALPVPSSAAAAAATEQSVTFTRSSNPSGVVTKHSVTFRQNSVVFLNNNNNNSIRHTSGSPTSSRQDQPEEQQQQQQQQQHPQRRNRRHSSAKSNKNQQQQQQQQNASADAWKESPSTKASALSLYPLPDTDAASLLRLHAVDPYTVSLDLLDQPASIRTVSVQELMDQLEMQVESNCCVIRGVRMVGCVVYISLDSSRSLAHLMEHSFRIQGILMRLVDVSSQQIIGLSNVPHYISDATVAMLLSAFGNVIGDVERRFLQGVDTGERFIRLKIRPQVKLPRHITIGGCRIQVRRVAPASQQPAASAKRQVLYKRPDVEPVARGTGNAEYSSLDAYRRRSDADADCVPLLSAGTSGVSGEEDSPHHKKPGGCAATTPKIGRAFEYRSHLKVNLRVAGDGNKLQPDPSPTCTVNGANCATADSSGAGASSSGGVVLSVGTAAPPPAKTPPCPVCEHKQAHPPQPPVKAPLPPPPKLVTRLCTGERCRALAAAAAAAAAQREALPKSRASVNFEDSAGGSCGRSYGGNRTSNGILRKSASGGGGGGAGESDGDRSPSDGGKNGFRAGSAKKTGRSFSLAETFRVKDRRKPVLRVETLVENTSAGADDGVKTSVIRRDSVSSSRSSRSSRKSNELPWCGCWGNGCL